MGHNATTKKFSFILSEILKTFLLLDSEKSASNTVLQVPHVWFAFLHESENSANLRSSTNMVPILYIMIYYRKRELKLGNTALINSFSDLNIMTYLGISSIVNIQGVYRILRFEL